MRGQTRVGIQADDLTGACDTGAVFAARGLDTVVLLPEAPEPARAPAILVLDTETRDLTEPEARTRARTAAARLAARRPVTLYKKVDSTLRGAVAAELGGVLEGAGLARAVLAPAFPAQGRTVVDAVVRLAGRPASETAIAHDPAFPATGASVLALLGIGGLRPAAAVPLALIREGRAAVAARLGRFDGAFVCDGETDADLTVVATASEGRPVLLAGSAGLAAALARCIASGPSRRPARLPLPLLVVAGSAHAATQAQVARLAEAGVGGHWLDVDGRVVDSRDPRPRGRASLGSSVPDSAFVALAPRPAGGAPGWRERAVTALAAAARERLETDGRVGGPGGTGTLLLTGGETAAGVCRALGATGLALAGEVEPGLALGTLLDGPFAGLAVVTKAGGFGDPETLVRVQGACQRREAARR